MNAAHTYNELANNFNLWMEFVDPDATMTEEEFDKMTEKSKIKLIEECFGEEQN